MAFPSRVMHAQACALNCAVDCMGEGEAVDHLLCSQDYALGLPMLDRLEVLRQLRQLISTAYGSTDAIECEEAEPGSAGFVTARLDVASG